jgi:hypothetical protein
MCLWNGLIATAPGHPFLAKAIETVVNNVRSRFTVAEYDNMFCPNPEISIIRNHDDLFTSGPCILGAAVNYVLGRHGQDQFEQGELNHENANVTIPGRSIILQDNKHDVRPKKDSESCSLLKCAVILSNMVYPFAIVRWKLIASHFGRRTSL